MGKVNSVVDLEDSPAMSTSKDKGKVKVDSPEDFHEDDLPMSSHQGRGLYWGMMDYTQVSRLVKEGADISFNLLMWLVQEVQDLHNKYDMIAR